MVLILNYRHFHLWSHIGLPFWPTIHVLLVFRSPRPCWFLRHFWCFWRGNGWQHKQSFRTWNSVCFVNGCIATAAMSFYGRRWDPQPLQHLQLGSAIKRTKSCEHPLQMSWSSINKPRAACRKPQLKSWPSINKPRAARWEPRNWNTIDPCLAPGSKRTFHPQIKENLWPRWLGNSWSLTSTPIPVASEAEGLGPSNQEAIVLLHPGHWNQDTCEAIAKLNYQHINYGRRKSQQFIACWKQKTRVRTVRTTRKQRTWRRTRRRLNSEQERNSQKEEMSTAPLSSARIALKGHPFAIITLSRLLVETISAVTFWLKAPWHTAWRRPRPCQWHIPQPSKPWSF